MQHMLCSVSGIENKEQKTQIKNSLNKIEGVGQVGVNLVSGTVDIKYNDPATAEEIKKCIKDTGFKIVYE